jgi:D-tyrosyl-tRNA(Tyr) deacylase
MKAIIQRVHSASVEVDSDLIAEIQSGLLVYICFESHDTFDIMENMIQKISKLRVFEDNEQKMNKNILEAKGSLLSVSQFTLSWDGKKGHRPSFEKSMTPNEAKVFYKKFNDRFEELNIPLGKGLFGANMQVKSTNDGPVSFFLDF